MAILAVSIGAALLWVTSNLATVSELLGRDDTLTGRTAIWAAIGPAIHQSYYLGYGWGALWAPGVPVTEAIWNTIGFRVYHAHDAYLDLLLQVGAIGLIIALAIATSTLVMTGRAYLRHGGPWTTWCLAIPIALLFYGFTEQSFVYPLGWLYLVVALTVATTFNERTRSDVPRAETGAR